MTRGCVTEGRLWPLKEIQAEETCQISRAGAFAGLYSGGFASGEGDGRPWSQPAAQGLVWVDSHWGRSLV